jgi:hypothetical protein
MSLKPIYYNPSNQDTLSLLGCFATDIHQLLALEGPGGKPWESEDTRLWMISSQGWTVARYRRPGEKTFQFALLLTLLLQD